MQRTALILGTIALILGTNVFAQQQQCPVLVGGASVYQGFQQPVALHIAWKNISSKKVIATRFEVGVVDAFGDIRDTVPGTEAEDTSKVKPGKVSKGVWANRGLFSEQTKITAWPTKVMFEDRSVWQDDGSRSCRAK